MNVPVEGSSREAVLSALQSFRADDKSWRSGKVLAYVFHAGDELESLLKEAHGLYASENALDPTTFPSVLRMERDVVGAMAELLRGDAGVAGNFTSGGTESILCAVKAARDYARAHRPAITEPEMVLSRTAHGAFHKACAYFGIKPVIVEFDPVTFTADVGQMRAAIGKNTIMLVASAPNYSQGVVDPVREIAALAREHDLWLHVDACMGGIALSMMRRTGGYDVPDFDFSVPGVTSISVDMHKYGYALKGASTVLYRSKAFRRHQIFACRSTTAYALVNAGVLSTRSAGPLASAWAALHYLGEAGYRESIREVMHATHKAVAGIDAIDGLRVLGRPAMPLLSFAADTVNVFDVADEMGARGWYVQPQFSTALSPPNLHLTLTPSFVPMADEFLRDLREALAAVAQTDSQATERAIRDQVTQALATLGPDTIRQLGVMGGLEGGQLPQRMATINTMLDAIPDELAEELLIDFMNDLYA